MNASARDNAPEDILRYMVNIRKSGKEGPGWPTFDGAYEPLASPPPRKSSLKAQWNHLREVYAELFVANQIGSDELSFNGGLRTSLATAFYRRTGRRFPANCSTR